MKSRLRKTVAVMLAFIMLLCTASVASAAEKSVDTVSARNAMIQEVTGTGKPEIIRNSGSIAAAKGIRLQTGDRLKTGQNAKLYMVIDGTNVIRLDEQSEAEVSNALFGRIKINLVSGRLFYNVTKTTSENESLDFMANNITIAVRGTSGMIGFGQGTVESMLFDGTVNIEMNGQKLVQVPAQEIFFKQEPGISTAEAIQIKEFTVNDIPESIINEMKNDNVLKDKIMKSVPTGKDAAGNPVFGDVNTDLTNVGKADNTMMPYSKPAEQKTTSSGGGSGSYNPKPQKILCPNCGIEVKNINEHSEGICKGGCGQTLYSCMEEAEKKLHTIKHCDDNILGFLVSYCSQNKEAVDMHEHMCDCGETYCVNKEKLLSALGEGTHWHHCNECGFDYCNKIEDNIKTHEYKCVSDGDFTGCRQEYCEIKNQETHEHVRLNCSDCNKSYCKALSNINSLYQTYDCGAHSGCAEHANDHIRKGYTCDYCKAAIFQCNIDQHGENCPLKSTTVTNAPLRNVLQQKSEEMKTEEKHNAEGVKDNFESLREATEPAKPNEPEIQASPENIQKEIEEEPEEQPEEQPKETPKEDNETN